jgi:hypothetical protein
VIPEEVRRLTALREEARHRRDFMAADALRERIRAAGFDVTDTPQGPSVTPSTPPETLVSHLFRTAGEVESILELSPTVDASVQWVVQGWPEDVVRGISSFGAHAGPATVGHVVVEAAGLPDFDWPEDVDVIHVDPTAGWAVARNAGLRRAAGSVVLVVDGSIEAAGDVVGPLADALADPSVGVTGPFGIVSSDLHEFRESAGPAVDAVEGYLMAFRRELLTAHAVRFDKKFRYYRTADIELSFQVKALGLRATVTPVPVIRHEHRMWAATPADRRGQLSKRNFYRFLDRWRGRTDLLVEHRPQDEGN